MCTIFAAESPNLILAKNYDSFIPHGMIFTNRRSMKKTSLVMPDQKIFEWSAKFGSITFSQSGKGMPVSGINEEGLIVEQATLPGTIYPPESNQAAISCLEATQYILDTCNSTDQAINSFSDFRISRTSWTIHFFICDKNGKMAIVEFIEGKIQIYRNEAMPLNVLTNSRYSLLCNSLNSQKDSTLNDYQKNSFSRFEYVSNSLKDKTDVTIADAFSILDGAKRPDTVWSCVYDVQNAKIFFRSLYDNTVKCINLKEIDFSQTAASYLYDFETSESDFKFEPYSRNQNHKNIADFFGNQMIIKMMNLPDSKFMIDAFDQHAEQAESGSL